MGSNETECEITDKGMIIVLQDYYDRICEALGYPHQTDIDVLVNSILDLRHEERHNIKPAQMDTKDGPVCGCGKPSKFESGWCGICIQ